MQAARPDLEVRHEPACCSSCGAGLAGRPVTGVERRQVFDLPPVTVKVTEHQLIERECGCGYRTRGGAPAGAEAPVQYGPRIAAIIVYLVSSIPGSSCRSSGPRRRWPSCSAPRCRQGRSRRSKCACFSGGADQYSTQANASATFTFTGNLIQFVSEQSSDRGSFKVYIDGTLQATVSNYSTTTHNAVVVWQESLATSGQHTLEIVNVGTSGHSRVDVDAFIVAT
jgi:hypothetical protein